MRPALLVLLGAAVALAGQWFHELRRDRKRRSVIILALEEELLAVEFLEGGFSGFTSQTFDELFPDISALLHPELARRVMNYHLSMKHIAARPPEYPGRIADVNRMHRIRDSLLVELEDQQPKRLKEDEMSGAAEELEG